MDRKEETQVGSQSGRGIIISYLGEKGRMSMLKNRGEVVSE